MTHNALARVLIPKPQQPGVSLRWATVTTVDPLTVTLDGETEALAGEPSRLIVPIAGDRVLVAMRGRRAIVMGSASAGDTGWVTLSLENSWVDYGTVYGTPAVRRIGNQVWMRGLVKSGSAATCTTLDAQFRPANYYIATSQSAGVNGQRVNVSSDGTVSFGAGYSTSWVDLNVAPWLVD